MNIAIRIATADHLEELQKIGKQTFYETFADDNTPENMEKYLEQGFSINQLTTELNNLSSEFYLATQGNKTIGYLKINSGASQTEINDNTALEIERIYVLKEFYGKEVGQLLFDKALQVAKKNKVHYLWLGVWERNPRAIKFYQKNGFVEFNKHIFKSGEDEQTDIMMKREVK
jgi:diamine N-acetyltransferase